MPVTRNIGKNTIGDNNKMDVTMHDYGMTTQNLSFVWRSTMGVGTLVPTMKLLCQKGDTVDIGMNCRVLTKPTLGALLGTFKMQNFLFYVPLRLYNSWLHNNRLGIGMDMKQVKLPQVVINKDKNGADELNNGLHSNSGSSLLFYLGIKGFNIQGGEAGKVEDLHIVRNAVPLLGYIDIFKNYFANVQEDTFYYVGHLSALVDYQVNYNQTSYPKFNLKNGDKSGGSRVPGNDIGTKYARLNISGPNAQIKAIPQGIVPKNWQDFWKETTIGFIVLNITKNIRYIGYNNASNLSSNITTDTILIDKGINADNLTQHTIPFTLDTTTWEGLIPRYGTDREDNDIYYAYLYYINSTYGDLKDSTNDYDAPSLVGQELATLDNLRDVILKADGNERLILNGDTTGKAPTTNEISDFINKLVGASRHTELGGLFIKTYDSDIFQNWIKSEWIEGPNSIGEITSVLIQDNKLNLDALNLQQKVYNMLNRIAVSGGTYRDWLETVYTAGRYIQRPETPTFEGGMSQLIQFDAIYSTNDTQTEEGGFQPFGSLSGKGFTTDQKGGRVHINCEEPGYIMGIAAITPLIDYYQGDDFDVYLETMDDLHKPALDGIGYQDSMNYLRVNCDGQYTTSGTKSHPDSSTSAGKTVAWLDYETNFNKTYGRLTNSENFMVLNRDYEVDARGNLLDCTTYIDPEKFQKIWAESKVTAQNFWVQTAFDITRRGNYTAHQIPTI